MKILLIDDNLTDRLLIKRQLASLASEVEVVEITSAADLQAALAAWDFQAVITDYDLRWSNGLEVLKLIRQRDPHLPVIMVTGTGTEEAAVAAMKAGLSDYLLKKRMKRLPAALEEAVRTAELEKRYKLTAAMLEQSERLYRGLVDSASDWLFTLDEHGRYVSVNNALARALKRQPEELVGKLVTDVHAREESAAYLERVQEVVEKGLPVTFAHGFEVDGELRWHRT